MYLLGSYCSHRLSCGKYTSYLVWPNLKRIRFLFDFSTGRGCLFVFSSIKFTINYPYLVTKRNIKVAVIAAWIVALLCGVSRAINSDVILTYFSVFVAFTFISCIIFMSCSYLILYRETLRHQKKIKTQQLPQEEVERFAKESKALKTTVFIVCAVVLCFEPAFFFFVLSVVKMFQASVSVFRPWVRTFAMLNSLLNPLIYCWRQKEMRKFIFRFQIQVVHPANWKQVKNKTKQINSEDSGYEKTQGRGSNFPYILLYEIWAMLSQLAKQSSGR